MTMRENSERLFARSRSVMPGGVSSPIRAFAPFPSFIRRGDGPLLFDVDGNRLVDFCLGYGPLILGHGHPAVFDAVMRQANEGLLFGAPSPNELEFAEKLVGRLPGADMVRFANSGGEATMHALRLARGFTGRDKVVKAVGGFHGAHDALLVKPGSAAMEACLPGSAGVPEGAVGSTLLMEFNDVEAAAGVLEGGDVAAVIVEPVMGNCGVVPPAPGYLRELRRMTEENGTLLIFDEVITGLRVAAGGAQELYGVEADLCTLGKAIGGGLPAGAVAGRRDIMELVSPQGPVYMAGTFSGNPLTAAAGLAVLNHLDAAVYRSLDSKGGTVVQGLRDIIADRRLKACVNSVGSMFQIFLGADEVSNGSDAAACDAAAFRGLFLHMLGEGHYLPPSQFESLFLCTEHQKQHLDGLMEAFDSGLREVERSV